jgi:murein L,D-transpeptidase YafK
VGDAAVLESLNEWAEAWARRDATAHFSAYDDSFVPQGGGTRANWEKRKRQVIGAAKSIEIKVESPSVERDEEGTAVVTFNQHYRSDSYSDAVVKQLRMVERDGRWLIVEEKVLSILRGARP